MDDEWWREVPIARTYYRVLLEEGRPANVFLDEVNRRWYRLKGNV